MTDYEFPDDWDEYTVKEKHIWFCNERARRQAKRQDDAMSTKIFRLDAHTRDE